MKDAEHASTAKLRKLMRAYNAKGDEASAFAVELELLSGGHEFVQPYKLGPNGDEEDAGVFVTETEAHCLVEVFTSERMVTGFYRGHPVMRIEIPMLMKICPLLGYDMILVDPETPHSTLIYFTEDGMVLIAFDLLDRTPRKARRRST